MTGVEELNHQHLAQPSKSAAQALQLGSMVGRPARQPKTKGLAGKPAAFSCAFLAPRIGVLRAGSVQYVVSFCRDILACSAAICTLAAFVHVWHDFLDGAIYINTRLCFF